MYDVSPSKPRGVGESRPWGDGQPRNCCIEVTDRSFKREDRGVSSRFHGHSFYSLRWLGLLKARARATDPESHSATPEGHAATALVHILVRNVIPSTSTPTRIPKLGSRTRRLVGIFHLSRRAACDRRNLPGELVHGILEL